MDTRKRSIEIVAAALRAEEPFPYPATVVDSLIAAGLINTGCNHGRSRGRDTVKPLYEAELARLSGCTSVETPAGQRETGQS